MYKCICNNEYKLKSKGDSIRKAPSNFPLTYSLTNRF